MKKKILTGVLASALLLGLVGCGGTNDTAQKGEETQVEQEETEEIEEDEEETGNPLAGLSDEEKEELFKEESKEPVRIAYNGGMCTSTPVLAEYLGLYEEEGLEIDISNTENYIEAIGTNTHDVTISHIASLSVPAINGTDMRFLTGTHTGCQSLYVLADAPYEKLEDLKGETISVPNGLGASSHNITMRFIGNDGLDPNDFEFVQVATDACIMALEKGEIAGVTMADQFAKKFVQDGTLKVVRSITYDDDFVDETCCIMGVNGTFLEENPVTCEKLSRVYQKANIWFENNKEEAVEFLLENDHISGEYDYSLTLANELYFGCREDDTKATLIDVITDYKKFDIVTVDKDVDELVASIWKPFDLDDERDEWEAQLKDITLNK